jgi:hypothetical protein
MMTGVAFTLVGENMEREKSMMYLTVLERTDAVLEQNRHCVSSTLHQLTQKPIVRQLRIWGHDPTRFR